MAAPTHVVSFGNTQATATVTTLAATAGSAIAIDDYILAFVQNAKTGTIVTVDDNLGHTSADYSHVIELPNESINSETFAVFRCKSRFAGTPTVTAHFTVGVGDCQIIGSVFRGVAPVGGINAFQVALQASPGTGANGITVGPVTPFTDDQMIVVFSGDSGALRASQYTVGTGFTMPFSQGSATALAGAVEYKAQTTATSVSGTFTATNNDETGTLMVTLRPIGAATVNTTYTTDFVGTENPLSEGSTWTDGLATGGSWGAVSKSGGKVIGNETGASGSDATSIKTGQWNPDQRVKATVFVTSIPASSCAPELELRLRAQLRSGVNSGYEITVGVDTANPYLIIARWNGPLASFSYISNNSTVTGGLVTGDVIEAAILGNVITVYKNGTQVKQVTDDYWAVGNPGIGFNLENGLTTCAGQNVNYGYTHFEVAQELAVAPPPVPVPISVYVNPLIRL